MKNCRGLWLFCLALTACASLPPLRPVEPSTDPAATAAACEVPIPRRSMQLTQALEAQWSSHQRQTLLSALAVDPAKRSLHVAIMTVEGLGVLEFQSADGQPVQIRRSLPGLDTEVMARTMDRDLRLAFFSPPGPLLASGRTDEGAWVCRYAAEEGSVIDISRPVAGEWYLAHYDLWGRALRRMRLREWTAQGLPGLIEVVSPGYPSYSLKISLVEALVSPD